jgi:hypothetical protein
MLEDYFQPEGASIKSILDITAKGTTSPTALTRRDVTAELAKLFRNLTPQEYASLRRYYLLRVTGDKLTTQATQARQRARNEGRGKRFKTAIAEVERAWSESRRGDTRKGG